VAIEYRKCPRCGHDNVPRALFCFQCGRNLDETPFVDGMRGTGRLIEDALKFIRERGHTLEPSRVERLKEAREKLPPEDLNGEPLTCLRCGTLNHASARVCSSCTSPLVIPDADFQMIPLSSARTSVGQVRPNNEDHVSTWAVDGVLLALVADGLGGATAGETASHLAVEAIQADFLGEGRGVQELHTLAEFDLSSRMSQAILDANMTVVNTAAQDPTLKGMGTTSTLALVRGNRVLVAHVGDSRAYHIDGDDAYITQITDDHSFVQALVASGHITQEQAEVHPMKNVLYRALGQSVDLEVDLYQRYLKTGDAVIICSDGLTRHVPPMDIAKIVMKAETPQQATQELIDLANSRGGEDNVSVIVIMMRPEKDSAPA
jgi:PPM family protein phosphatase